MAPDLSRAFDCLNQQNWATFSSAFQALMGIKGYWDFFDGTETVPIFIDSNNLTKDERKELKDYKKDLAAAAGYIWLYLDPSQQAHVNDLKGNPTAIWKKLEGIHQQQKPGNRFNAYEKLFNIHKEDDESLTTLVGRVETSMYAIQALRPTTFTIKELDQELQSMALMRALPEEYDAFASSLLLLDSLALDKLVAAFHTEEAQRAARAEAALRAANSAHAYAHAAAAASGTACACAASSAPSSTPLSGLVCEWCTRSGHLEKDCFKKAKAKRFAVEESQSGGWKKKTNKPGYDRANVVEETASAASVDPRSAPSSDWNPDTGASSHMTPHRHWFFVYSPHVVPIRLADDKVIHSEGIGSVIFWPRDENGRKMEQVEFQDVLHVPALRNNLLSPFHLTRRKGYTVKIINSSVMFHQGSHLRFIATVNNNNVGYLNGSTLTSINSFANTSTATTRIADIQLVHERFGHLNHQMLRRAISKGLVTGLPKGLDTTLNVDPICEPCIFGKQHRHNIPRSPSTPHSETIARIHSDLKGPLITSADGGAHYWVTFVCDRLRYLTVDFLKQKSQTFQSFKRFKRYVEKFHGLEIKLFRCDTGGEFMDGVFRSFCKDEGIKREHTETDEPHQNGIAERVNRTMAEGATAMLVQSRLPPSFWKPAIEAFVYVWNRCPTEPFPDTTPYTGWNRNPPNIANLRVFGCLSYVLIRKKNRRKQVLADHSRKCIFVGYPEESKTWRFFDTVTKKFFNSSNVTFDERVFPGNHKVLVNPFGDLFPNFAPPLLRDSPSIDVDSLPRQGGDDSDNDAPENPPSPPLPAVFTPPGSPLLPNRPLSSLSDLSDLTELPLTPPPIRSIASKELPVRKDGLADLGPGYGRGMRDRQPWNYGATANLNAVEAVLSAQVDFDQPSPEGDYLSVPEVFEFAFYGITHTANKASVHDGEPRSYREACSRPPEEASQWHQAAVDEINALVDNDVFELVKRPADRKAIGGRWVFKVKRNPDGSIERYKGRYVAKGYDQRFGRDFDQTFSPTPRWAALRAVLALGALEDLELMSADISSAFLNGELSEEVYVEQPEGFEQKGKDWVWRLFKSLYGLKQAGREWHNKLHATLTSEAMGFRRVRCEHSIWVYASGDVRIIIPVFVDDLTIAAKSTESARNVITKLREFFKLRDLGPTSFLLGVEIIRDRPRRSLTLSQRQYSLDILARVGMSDCNSVSTPLDPSIKLSKDMGPCSPADHEFMLDKPYINTVGAVAYLATATRPDLAFPISVLSRFNKNPGPAHWEALKRVLRYIKGTVDYKIEYAPDPTQSGELFTTYCDADHGGNPDNGRSTTGWVVKMGTGAISWLSRLQSIVTLSTTESEYVSGCSSGQEIMWLRNLFTEFGYTLSSPSQLYTDNQSAMAVARNPEHHGRVKHLDLKFYWLRDAVHHQHIRIDHLRTDDMPADILTKALGREKLQHMVKLLGIISS